MEATKMLSREHRIIEQVIGALEAEVEAARERGSLERGAAEKVLAFIGEYADGLHHRKEEDLLFAALGEAGLPREQGPVGVMLAEHEEGRRLVLEMRKSLPAACLGDASGLEAFARAALSYGGLLRQHIYKEDNILYSMASEILPPAVQEGLRAAFLKIDAEAADLRRRHEEAAAELGRLYEVEREEAAA